jgi:hypothetical protein
MAKRRKASEGHAARRDQREKLSAKESLKRLQEFAQRKEQFIAAVRKGKNRGVSA